MKYLSFITVLILLATLFSFVFTQLNKDETKHEYGIAFPLEESESRLPPLSSIVQSESDAQNALSKLASLPNVESLNEATTTTDTIPTSSTRTTTEGTPVDPTDGGKSEEVTGGENDGSSSIVIETIPDVNGSNETDSDGSKLLDSSAEEGDQPATNPKLIFIERLMGMNFQRAPGNGFSSFLEVRDSVMGDGADGEANKTLTPSDSSAESVDAAPMPKDLINNLPTTPQELPWGNTLDSLRSRWESRIRKFTFPFQNSYSVVLRASSVGDSDASKDGSLESAESNDNNGADSLAADKVPVMKDAEVTPATPNKYFFQSPMAAANQGQGPVSPSATSPQNQLLRMAALSMMSKLFSALRNQVYSNPKLDSASSRFADHHHDHDLDLDDDDDDSDSDSDRGASEGLPVPIIIARPKINMEQSPYGYGSAADAEQPMRTTIMYGRPAPSVAAHQQGPTSMMFAAQPQRGLYGAQRQQGPMSPLGAILAAAAQQASYRRLEAPQPSMEPQQPQRVILLISRPQSEPSPRIQVISRDEPQQSYQQSAQPMVHYSPLSAPSSPVYFHYSPSAHSPVIASPQQQSRPQPHVVEVPVPVYLPMMSRMQRSSFRNAPQSPMMRSYAMPRMMPQEAAHRMMPQDMPRMVQESSPTQSGPGHVAILYYHNPEQEQSPSNLQEQYQSQPEAQPEQEIPQGYVRIMLRPKLSAAAPMAAPIAQPNPLSRMAYHRRLDESEEDNQVSPMAGHDMIDGPRLRQWRDYSQFVRSAPAPQAHAPVAHLLITTSRSEEPEAASSEEQYHHHHHQQPQPFASHPAVSPFFFHANQQAHSEQDAVAPHQQQQPHHLFMAHPAASAYQPQMPQHQQPAQAQQSAAGSAGPHAAFFILADPHGAQQEGNQNNDA